MICLYRQDVADNGELFAFVAWEEMRVPHGHSNVLMSHQLLKFHERNFTGLCQPGCECMPHGVQSNSIQTVAVFRSQSELLDGSLEAGGCLCKSCFLQGPLENRLCRLSMVALKHIDYILWNSDKNSLSSLLDNVQPQSVGVHILPAQFEYFRRSEAGLQRKQGHIMQLWMPELQIIQERLCLFSCQETQAFVIGLNHFPRATLGGQWIDAAPHADGDGTVYGGSHKRKDIVHRLSGQKFAGLFSFGLFAAGLFGRGVSNRRLQQLRLQVGKQIRGQIDNGHPVDFSLQMGAILAVMLVNVLTLAPAPRKIGVHNLADSYFIALNRIDSSCLELGKKPCPLSSGRGRADALAVPTDGFPMGFPLGISVPETVDFVVLSGSRITLGGLTEEDALELSLYIFSFLFCAHVSNIMGIKKESKILIQNLSKMDLLDKDSLINLLILYYFMCVTGLTSDRERERERACPACGETSFTLCFYKDQYRYCRCVSCGLRRISPQPTSLELDTIYSSGYFDAWGKEADYKACKRHHFSAILERLPRPLSPGAKVLDVGAATGIFMELLREKGYEAYGVELSADGYQVMAEKFSADRIFNGFFEETDFSPVVRDTKFSCLFMCDFFEHVRDPDITLQKAASLLKPGGQLAIHVPNVKSFPAKLFGKYWEFYTTDHLYYYSPDILHLLLKKHGFSLNSIQRGWKYMTLDYASRILSTRLKGGPLSLLNPLLRLFPDSIRKYPLKLYYGETICYAMLAG